MRLAIIVALLLASPASAQKAAVAKPEPVKPAAPTEPPPPPYDPQLLRLAEIMGTLAYLRPLCAASDGEQWRVKMAAIIDSEATTPARRQRLAGAYNHGFRGYEITYRTCTANAEAIISRFLDEGTRLAHEIGNRYSGG